MTHLKSKLSEEADRINESVKNRGDFTPAELDQIHKIMGALFYMNGTDSGAKHGSVISASDELAGADKYLHEFMKTGEDYCLDIAGDKLRHSRILLDMMPEGHKDKAILLDWYADLESKLKMYKPSRL